MTNQGEKLRKEDKAFLYTAVFCIMLIVLSVYFRIQRDTARTQLSQAHTEAARLRGQTAKTPPTVQKLRNAYKALEAIITDQIDYSKKQAELNKALSAEVAELKERLGE